MFPLSHAALLVSRRDYSTQQGEYIVNGALYYSIFIEDKALHRRGKNIWK